MARAMRNPGELIPRHLHLLDALRGVASLAVVVFHYKNFLYRGDSSPPPLATAALPFDRYLWPMFENGYQAVPLFFTLSGFVFFWLYQRPVAERTLGGSEFFVLRFSRLYPLHFATLVLVLVFQWLYGRIHPELPFFVSPLNDSYHFVLHLFFASNWLPSSGFSFNFPVWSVSIEVLLYAIFLVFARFVPSRPWSLAAMVVAGLWIVSRVNANLGIGIGCFFAGGLTYLAYRRLMASKFRARWTFGLLALAVCIWIVGSYGGAVSWSFVPESWLKRTRYVPMLLMFPSLVLSCAMLESFTGIGRRAAWLGDISYATYLLHFPLQLVFVLIVDSAGVSRGVFYSPLVFLLFFAVLIPLAWMTFHLFERPSQRYLRKLGEPVRVVSPTQAPLRES